MKRRKTQQTIRAARAGINKVLTEQKSWIFFQEADMANQYGSFGTSYTVEGFFSVGDVITINNSDITSCAFGIDLAYKPVNIKRVHPARRRKAMQKQKGMMNDSMTITSGGSVLDCKKIDQSTWVITGAIN